MNVTLPLEFVVPLTLMAIGPSCSLTVAPFWLTPLRLTLTVTVPVGRLSVTLAVLPDGTVVVVDAL